MNDLVVTQTEKNIKTKVPPIHLNWMDNPSIQKLLDVVASIITQEYIQIAKQNPNIFSNGGAK